MDVYINKNINLNFELAEENYDKVKDGDNKFKIITAEFSNQYNDMITSYLYPTWILNYQKMN